MKTKNQTGLKNFKPKINLNHNISTTMTRMLLLFKAVQVIVQSRLGEKIHTKSKPNAMGQDWVSFKPDMHHNITKLYL